VAVGWRRGGCVVFCWSVFQLLWYHKPHLFLDISCGGGVCVDLWEYRKYDYETIGLLQLWYWYVVSLKSSYVWEHVFQIQHLVVSRHHVRAGDASGPVLPSCCAAGYCFCVEDFCKCILWCLVRHCGHYGGLIIFVEKLFHCLLVCVQTYMCGVEICCFLVEVCL
jgi:hypothetical protein